MNYSVYVDKILENIGRCPGEIAIVKHNITYKNLITALMSTKNTQEAARLLQLPTYSIQNAMYLRLNKELPQKQGKSSWNIVLLDSLGLFKCSVCNLIQDSDNRSLAKSKKTDYICKNCRSNAGKIYYEDNAEHIKDKFKHRYQNNKSYYSEKG